MGVGVLPDSSDLVQRVTALRDALPEPETSLHLYSGAEVASKTGRRRGRSADAGSRTTRSRAIT